MEWRPSVYPATPSLTTQIVEMEIDLLQARAALRRQVSSLLVGQRDAVRLQLGSLPRALKGEHPLTRWRAEHVCVGRVLVASRVDSEHLQKRLEPRRDRHGPVRFRFRLGRW